MYFSFFSFRFFSLFFTGGGIDGQLRRYDPFGSRPQDSGLCEGMYLVVKEYVKSQALLFLDALGGWGFGQRGNEGRTPNPAPDRLKHQIKQDPAPDRLKH